MKQQYDLPSLPEGGCASDWGGRETGPCLHFDEAVLAYARVAIEPYVKRIDELEADRQQRGVPVAYAIKAENTGKIVSLVLAGEDADFEGVPQMRPEHVVPLYASPQPAEPSSKDSDDFFTNADSKLRDLNEPVKVPSDEYFRGRADWDLHDENIMLDADGHFYFTDPVSFKTATGEDDEYL